MKPLTPNMQGACWMAATTVLATAMSVGIKDAATALDTMQIVFIRCAVGMIFLVPILAVAGQRRKRLEGAERARARSPFRPGERWRLLVFRGLVATFAVNFGYYAIANMPLATVTVLFFTAPLFVTILAGPMLGEKVGWRRWSATSVGFVGAVIAVGPEIARIDWVLAAPFLSSLTFAASLVMGKQLSRTESPDTILVYTNGVLALGSFGPAVLVWAWPPADMMLTLVALSLFALGRTYTDIRAYAIAEASFVAPFGYLRLPAMALAGYLAFGEIPDGGAMAGAGVIIASAIYIARREGHHRRPVSKPVADGPPD